MPSGLVVVQAVRGEAIILPLDDLLSFFFLTSGSCLERGLLLV